nr:molybdenum cofactor sulfurase [Quercus suber]
MGEAVTRSKRFEALHGGFMRHAKAFRPLLINESVCLSLLLSQRASGVVGFPHKTISVASCNQCYDCPSADVPGRLWVRGSPGTVQGTRSTSAPATTEHVSLPDLTSLYTRLANEWDDLSVQGRSPPKKRDQGENDPCANISRLLAALRRLRLKTLPITSAINMLGGTHIPENGDEYDSYISQMRRKEFPMLKESLYLDHAGTTLYSTSLMDRFYADMTRNLYGNPHSASPSSQRATMEIEDVRLQLLRYFQADPHDFDVIFTANATAGIKIVAEAFREQKNGFSYGYHIDSHTSLVGVREMTVEHKCFESVESVVSWTEKCVNDGTARLIAYPAQSNMTGRRLPLDWSNRIRSACPERAIHTLLDAAALATTSTLDLSDAETAPDFTVLSLYKIFGFPDLGALLVHKRSSHVFDRRRYFGGGTVDMVVCMKEQWHAPKSGSLHERLEDGTLPVHSIIALKAALQTRIDLFGHYDRISQHTSYLVRLLYEGLSTLKHANMQHVCTIYKHKDSTYGDIATQGPIIAFNLRDRRGGWISTHEFEKVAVVNDIHIRTGGMCNPGGMVSALKLSPWELRENFSAGVRCGSENDIANGKPTGLIRVSLGAMSTKSDIHRFLAFLGEYFVDHGVEMSRPPSPLALWDNGRNIFHVESLNVYPIKSCGSWQIPPNCPWTIQQEGLAWDREWCIVHQGSGKALSQKQYPAMALVRPSLDFKTGVLNVVAPGVAGSISVSLSNDPRYFAAPGFKTIDANVCGDTIETRVYSSESIADFFTKALGVPCTLARHPTVSNTSPTSVRHSKPHLRSNRMKPQGILYSNESPILIISRSSLNRLNEMIKAHGGKAAHPSVFRANIVLAEDPLLPPGQERPWLEDHWDRVRFGDANGPTLKCLGGCRRCQMVCIDQGSGEKNQEPFVTLAKSRRVQGRVLFGVHSALTQEQNGTNSMVQVGDLVETFMGDSSNESPILIISRSSLNRLNEMIKAHGGKAAHPSVFRANIVLAEDPLLPPGQERPWLEDHWDRVRFGDANGPTLKCLGGCRRCQMVCIDQGSGEKNQEPFVTLAKSRRVQGRVLFGVHSALTQEQNGTNSMVQVGDLVETFMGDSIHT